MTALGAADVTPDVLRAVTDLAAYAPVVQGGRPWRFRGTDHTIDLVADAGWSPQRGDAVDRQQHIAAGVGLELARLAIRGRGLTCVVRIASQCEGGPGHLLATLTAGHEFAPTAYERRLIEAAPRCTQAPTRGGAPHPLRNAMAVVGGAVQESGCWLRVLNRPGDRAAAAGLLAQMDHLGGDLPPPSAGDTLLLVGTNEDTPRAWIRSGRALALALLVLTDAGIGTDWSAGVTDTSRVRLRLQQDLGLIGSPQLMLAVA